MKEKFRIIKETELGITVYYPERWIELDEHGFWYRFGDCYTHKEGAERRIETYLKNSRKYRAVLTSEVVSEWEQ